MPNDSPRNHLSSGSTSRSDTVLNVKSRRCNSGVERQSRINHAVNDMRQFSHHRTYHIFMRQTCSFESIPNVEGHPLCS